MQYKSISCDNDEEARNIEEIIHKIIGKFRLTKHITVNVYHSLHPEINTELHEINEEKKDTILIKRPFWAISSTWAHWRSSSSGEAPD